MKFVNKLSLISLIVLMFSFMNVAQAAGAGIYCPSTLNGVSRTEVTACSKIKDPTQCGNSYLMTTTPGSGILCKWNGASCSDGGRACTTKECLPSEIVSGTCPYEQLK